MPPVEIDTQITVELRPHIGVTGTPLGNFKEALDQWMVFGNSPDHPNVFLGYLPFDAKGKFGPYTTWHLFPEQTQEHIRLAMSKACGRDVVIGNVPLDPNSAVGLEFLRSGTVSNTTTVFVVDGPEDDEDEDDETDE